MGSRSKPRNREPVPFVLGKTHAGWLDARTGLEEAGRGDTIALTHGEANAWARTGELPKRVYRWHDKTIASRRGT
jgi:hypothetical protein